jgi:hypothetical protein
VQDKKNIPSWVNRSANFGNSLFGPAQGAGGKQAVATLPEQKPSGELRTASVMLTWWVLLRSVCVGRRSPAGWQLSSRCACQGQQERQR